MPSTTFVQRLINVVFTLNPQKPPFQESGTNTLTLSNLRVSAKIVRAATPALGQLSMTIFGMTLSQMNQLSTWGIAYQAVPGNTVTVLAGDSSNPTLPIAFYGTVIQAWSDFSNSPEVAFHVEAQTFGVESVISAPATTVRGVADAASIIQNLATSVNCTFENNGVSTKLSNPYFYGSPRTQIQECAAAAGCDWCVENKTVAIMPKAKSRSGVTVISPSTGMIGYPTFTQYGVKIKTLFNPNLRYRSSIQIKDSILTPANGMEWTVYMMDHDISSRTPHGDWSTSIDAWNPKYPQPLPR